MARAVAHKKPPRGKRRQAVPRIKKVSVRPKAHAKSAHRKVLTSRKEAEHKLVMKTVKKGAKQAAALVSGEAARTGAASRNNRIGVIPHAPSRLLRDSKTTTAALAVLEKGIKLIYQKDFKKARQELKSLIETHPEEPEIIAGARSYIQICDREEAVHKKPAVGNDQPYSLGVIEHNRGNYDAALAQFRLSLERHPNADYIYYSIAASLAMKGELQEAIRNLGRAIDLGEDNRVYAKNDADFASLHGQKEFSDLVGLPPGPNHESQQ